MNVFEADKIQIISWLESEKINIFTLKNGCAWFLSPLHNEKTASFKVDLTKNVWYDFGLCVGGGLIDLVMKVNNTDVSGALKLLSGSQASINTHSFSFPQHDFIPDKVSIKHVQPLQNTALLEYLQSRKIPFLIANNYLKEAYYTMNRKNFFALAFKNYSSGYELRNKYFKGCTAPKNYTLIDRGTKNINVFEGFFDFLSALVYYGLKHPNNTTIVLNGIGLINRVKEILSGYETKNLFLDNDTAGQNIANDLEMSGKGYINRSKEIFPAFKDFNEFLTQNQDFDQKK